MDLPPNFVNVIQISPSSNKPTAPHKVLEFWSKETTFTHSFLCPKMYPIFYKEKHVSGDHKGNTYFCLTKYSEKVLQERGKTKKVFSVIFQLYKFLVPWQGRTEKAVAATSSGGLKLGPSHSLSNHGQQLVGHFADFSTALKTKIFHFTGESEWNRGK